MVDPEKDIDYEKDVTINQFELERCLVEQPSKRAHWTKLWAQAKIEKSRAKQELTIVRSKLAQEAKNKWEILGFPKMPTDQMVNEWVPLQPDYKEAELYFNEASRRVDILAGAKDAFDDRRSSLSDLVKLYLHGYYADESMVGPEARQLLQEVRTDNRLQKLNKNDQRQLLRRRKK